MKNLLVPIDFSDVTDRVIATAEQMARAFGAKIWLMHCVREYPVFAPMEIAPVVVPNSDLGLPQKFPEQYQQLTSAVTSLANKGINVEELFVAGVPSDEIAFVANHYLMDLIIMGSHGHGAFYEAVVGSVTHSVLYQTNRMSLIVPSVANRESKAVPAKQWDEPLATPY